MADLNIIDVFFTHDGYDKIRSDDEASKIPTLKSLENNLKWVKSVDSSKFSNRLDIVSRRKLDYFYKIETYLPKNILSVIVDELSALEYVKFAEVRLKELPSGVTLDDINNENNETLDESAIGDFIPLQNYLNAPVTNGRAGLNVSNSWIKDSGENSTIRHLDFGIYEDHDNFVDTKLTVRSNRTDDRNHGTASASIISGYNKARGMRGISYQSKYFAYDTGESELMAVECNPGDIYSIEFQYSIKYDNESILVPPVYSSRIRELIKMVIEDGVIAIYSGGNGNLNLKDRPEFKNMEDCGGIMCCACNFNTGNRASFSNYNFNKMLNASGDWKVFAAGYGSYLNVSTPNKTWTATYSGTSAAQPQIAGVIGVLNSYHKKIHGVYMTTESIYNVLSKTGNIVDQMIGAIPNLHEALANIEKNEGVDDEVYVISTDYEFKLLSNPYNTYINELSEKYRRFSIEVFNSGTFLFYLNSAPEGVVVDVNNFAYNGAVYVYDTVQNGKLTLLTSSNRYATFVMSDGKFVLKN